jgi:glutamate-1-semialdehyde 2,1-aminomutase
VTRILNECYDSIERATEAKGKYIKIDGKWLLDTSMGAGTDIFGHGTILKSIKKDINKGSLFIVPNKMADECGELLHEITKFYKFVFCNTGSEATLRCIRIARAYTGRDKIVLFEGCWHGTHDWNLALYSKGIPQAVKDMVIVLLPTTIESLNRLQQKDIALVMIEPIQASLPINKKEFLESLKHICYNTGTVLCFDEVISGFRMALGGASEYYNIKPDLVAYGKIVGGGLPIGIIGGDSIMDIIKSGVRMGGTFSANPFIMKSCKTVLEKLIEEKPHSQIHKIMSGLSKIKSDILQIIVLGGMARLLFTNKKIESISERNKLELSTEKQKKIISRLRELGIYISWNNNFYFSTKHTKEDVEMIKHCLEANYEFYIN